MTARLGQLLPLLALLALPSAVSAHRLDEYLQATLVVIGPDAIRLRINLTPGVEVSEKVLVQIDRNHDGAISTVEATAYAGLLKRDLTLHLDGRKLDLQLNTTQFPAPTELRTGLGIVQIEFSAKPGPLAVGTHTLKFENRHQTSISVYLLNAALPQSDAVQITRQKRNVSQSAGEIDFTLRNRS